MKQSEKQVLAIVCILIIFVITFYTPSKIELRPVPHAEQTWLWQCIDKGFELNQFKVSALHEQELYKFFVSYCQCRDELFSHEQCSTLQSEYLLEQNLYFPQFEEDECLSTCNEYEICMHGECVINFDYTKNIE